MYLSAAFAFDNGGLKQGNSFPKCFCRKRWDGSIKMNFRKLHCEEIRWMETDLRLCAVAGCGISSINPLASNTIVVDKLNIS
jgi:hypothetical protein